MDTKHTFDEIDRSTFEQVLQTYAPTVKSDQLDKLRYETIPDAVETRSGDPHVDKEEVVGLVTWKLAHGTFRPRLKALVQQNDSVYVEETTRKGFNEFEGGKVKDSIKTLTQLQGIGPATASLLLSVYSPKTAPFFSDELFRWAFFEDGGAKGWDRRIKYTAKEYDDLYGRVHELLARLGVSAVEAEKVAYVLGKQGLGGARSKDDVAGPGKRKVEEMDHSIPIATGSKKAKASIKDDRRNEAVKPQRQARDLPDELQRDGKTATPLRRQTRSTNPSGKSKRSDRM